MLPSPPRNAGGITNSSGSGRVGKVEAMLPFMFVLVLPEKTTAKVELGAPLADMSSDNQRDITPTVIGPDSTFTGDLETKGQLQIDGAVHGEIRGSAVVIDMTGRVTAALSPRRLISAAT